MTYVDRTTQRFPDYLSLDQLRELVAELEHALDVVEDACSTAGLIQDVWPWFAGRSRWYEIDSVPSPAQRWALHGLITIRDRLDWLQEQLHKREVAEIHFRGEVTA